MKKDKKIKKNISVSSQNIVDNDTKFETKKGHWKYLILLFVLSFGIYANTLENGWVLDDNLVIMGNSFTKQGVSGLKDIWTKDMFVGAHGKEFELTGGRYRPLSLTIFALQYEFFGENPMVGHLTNILFYGLSVMLIFIFLTRLLPSQNPWFAFVTAGLFAAHPIHTEVVANIKSLDEILALFFLLLSFIFILKKDKKMLYAGITCYFLSLLSKENTITALAIIPLMLYIFQKETIKNSLLKTLPYFLVAIVYLILREKFSGGFSSGLEAKNLMDSPFLGAPFEKKLATLVLIAGKYLSLLIAPIQLSYDYSYNALGWQTWGNWSVLVSLIIIVVIILYAIKKIKKIQQENSTIQLLVFGILFYFISYSIVSNVVFNIGTYMGERFVYLPSLGFCMMLTALLHLILKTDTQQPLTYQAKWLVPVIILFSLGTYASFERNKDWKDNFTLYEADIHKVPNSARARMFYGIELLNKYYRTKEDNFLDRAITEITEATKIYPDFYHAYYNLGLAYQAKKEHQKAVAVFSEVLRIQPTHINSHYYIGMSYGAGFQNTEKAIEHMERGIAYGFTSPDRYLNLGVAYGIAGNLTKAAEKFEIAATENPTNPDVYKNLAITYKNLGNEQKFEENDSKYKQLIQK
jgi:protein O-mannosyl-transferase